MSLNVPSYRNVEFLMNKEFPPNQAFCETTHRNREEDRIDCLPRVQQPAAWLEEMKRRALWDKQGDADPQSTWVSRVLG
jgi:hypothetical protein